MELKDIVLKKDDIVYIKEPNNICYMTINKLQEGLTIKACNEYLLPRNHIIVKVERPVKYETIYEASKQILDKKEKDWLENFLRPFVKDFVSIVKTSSILLDRDKSEYIQIKLKYDIINLPAFKENTIYKGMEYNKEYTLEKLGLFKGE